MKSNWSYFLLLSFVLSCSTRPNVLEDKEEHNASSRYFDYVQKKLGGIENSPKVLSCIQEERTRIGDNIPENRIITISYLIDMNGFISPDGIRVLAEFPITINFESCLKTILTRMIFEIPYDLKPFQGQFELDINPEQEKL